MNDHRLQQNLKAARACLIGSSERLATFRRLGCLNSNDRDLMAHAEDCFRDALDQVWDAQCMVGGSVR